MSRGKKEKKYVYVSTRPLLAHMTMALGWAVTLFIIVMKTVNPKLASVLVGFLIVLTILSFVIGRKERAKMFKALSEGTIMLTSKQSVIVFLYIFVFALIMAVLGGLN